jgi:hypothetical protein
MNDEHSDREWEEVKVMVEKEMVKKVMIMEEVV